MDKVTILVDRLQLAAFLSEGTVPTNWVRYDGKSEYSTQSMVEFSVDQSLLAQWLGKKEAVASSRTLLKG